MRESHVQVARPPQDPDDQGLGEGQSAIRQLAESGKIRVVLAFRGA